MDGKTIDGEKIVVEPTSKGRFRFYELRRGQRKARSFPQRQVFHVRAVRSLVSI